ncbi:17801_t:CDS:2 [Gigaspora rosea]|nr:17801_t:CDS:2 [Gigaspora rosea]
MDNGHEYYLYLHPTLVTHYAARRLDLQRAVVAEGAQQAGLDVNSIQQSELSATGQNMKSPVSGVLAIKIKINPEEYQQLKLYLETNNLPQGLDAERQEKIKSKSRFFECKNGLLYKKDRRDQSKGKLLKVVTESEVEQILYLMHDHPTNRHFGIDGMYGKIKKIYYWPQMYEDIHTYIQSCDEC